MRRKFRHQNKKINAKICAWNRIEHLTKSGNFIRLNDHPLFPMDIGKLVLITLMKKLFIKIGRTFICEISEL